MVLSATAVETRYTDYLGFSVEALTAARHLISDCRPQTFIADMVAHSSIKACPSMPREAATSVALKIEQATHDEIMRLIDRLLNEQSAQLLAARRASHSFVPIVVPEDVPSFIREPRGNTQRRSILSALQRMQRELSALGLLLGRGDADTDFAVPSPPPAASSADVARSKKIDSTTDAHNWQVFVAFMDEQFSEFCCLHAVELLKALSPTLDVATAKTRVVAWNKTREATGELAPFRASQNYDLASLPPTPTGDTRSDTHPHNRAPKRPSSSRTVSSQRRMARQG